MSVSILVGDCREVLRTIPDKSVQTCVTSPPYFGLRDYGHDAQIGQEIEPWEFVEALVEVCREVRRTLRDDGTLWLNLGDSYASRPNGSIGKESRLEGAYTSHTEYRRAHALRKKRLPSGLKHKDLIGVPWEVAFALREDGWYLRSEIIWAKPNGMPGSQEDRPTSSHETIFLLSKSESYWSDFDAIKTPPRESTLVRASQNIQAQAGSHRANGGTKTTKGCLGITPQGDKPRGHRRPHAGFNARWDAMDKGEQQAKPAMMRDVWFVSPGGFDGPHFAVMPEEIARRCILAGAPEGAMVLDPFGGAGTTGLIAARYGRQATMIELNPENAAMAQRRIKSEMHPVSGADEALGLEPLPLFAGCAE